MGYVASPSWCKMCLHPQRATILKPHASIWLHQICPHGHEHSAGLRLAGCIFARNLAGHDIGPTGNSWTSTQQISKDQWGTFKTTNSSSMVSIIIVVFLAYVTTAFIIILTWRNWPLQSDSLSPSYMGAHGHFPLKPTKCWGTACGPKMSWWDFCKEWVVR